MNLWKIQKSVEYLFTLVEVVVIDMLHKRLFDEPHEDVEAVRVRDRLLVELKALT